MTKREEIKCKKEDNCNDLVVTKRAQRCLKYEALRKERLRAEALMHGVCIMTKREEIKCMKEEHCNELVVTKRVQRCLKYEALRKERLRAEALRKEKLRAEALRHDVYIMTKREEIKCKKEEICNELVVTKRAQRCLKYEALRKEKLSAEALRKEKLREKLRADGSKRVLRPRLRSNSSIKRTNGSIEHTNGSIEHTNGRIIRTICIETGCSAPRDNGARCTECLRNYNAKRTRLRRESDLKEHNSLFTRCQWALCEKNIYNAPISIYCKAHTRIRTQNNTSDRRRRAVNRAKTWEKLFRKPPKGADSTRTSGRYVKDDSRALQQCGVVCQDHSVCGNWTRNIIPIHCLHKANQTRYVPTSASAWPKYVRSWKHIKDDIYEGVCLHPWCKEVQRFPYCPTHMAITLAVEVKQSTIPSLRYGLFVLAAFVADEFIVELAGERLPTTGDVCEGDYLMSVEYNGERIIVNSDTSMHGVGRYANTGVNAFQNNARFQAYVVDGVLRVYIMATRLIKKGEEIFVAYGPDYDLRNSRTDTSRFR
ncbi:hypothetical protein SARC_14258 [Sphaeroforma arctica JP610]|uniref:SET domain-containing protein n=1 Tax=Sphaeroforma arctica JP610 TaxID=667725 RepID=A0A0L0F8Y6_9EUKA|nr:hypothetical protein SARC_14258 [Sphaeroforma arctica JP610]KNC73184.1 hypothetical protein SARC_14258 [Sphaeroforma arctica JP610]|eukprot:XP_014147086.1 hypothetical protein SARC_14258 [Sphaeroforma arctica JP610]